MRKSKNVGITYLVGMPQTAVERKKRNEWVLSEGIPEGQNVPVYLPPEIEDGVYANWAVVHHTAHEITIDFCQQGIDPPMEPGQLSRAKVVSRVHVPPTFVMSLLQILSQSSAQREELMRQIEEGGQEHGA